MTKSLAFEQLVDWVEGRLGEEEAVTMTTRVAQADAQTQATVAWLRTFFQTSEAVVLERPPQKVRDLLARRFEAYAQARRQPGFLQRLVASLTFDSNLQLAPAGARDVDIQPLSRQLVYTAGAVDIALHVYRQSGKETLSIAGQVFPGDDTAPGMFTVLLLRDGVEIGLVTADDLGEFSFAGPFLSGVYTLILSSGEADILVPGIKLED